MIPEIILKGSRKERKGLRKDRKEINKSERR